MAAIVTTIVVAFGRFFGFLRVLWNVLAVFIETVWAVSMAVIQLVINVVATMLAFLFQMLTEILVALMGIGLSILPDMPTEKTEIEFNTLGAINRYVPVSEMTALLSLWLFVFGTIGAYKLAKFIRGAG